MPQVSTSNESIQKIITQVSDELMGSLQDALKKALEKEVTKTITNALMESEFHRQINEEMRSGLQSIYKEISNATSNKNAGTIGDVDKKGTEQLLTEVSSQLDEVLVTTTDATENIMTIIEKHLALQSESAAMLAILNGENATPGPTKAALIGLNSINSSLNKDLNAIMTALSFHDLTSQRIKKIIEAVQKIENIVLNLYLSTGLSLKTREENPDTNYSEIKEKTQKTVSELKGPASDVSQNNVDDLLSQLGL